MARRARSLLFFFLWLLSPATLQAVSFQMARVGNPGNADSISGLYPFGGVAYKYEISKTEVSASQYLEFLNLVDPTGANELGLYEAPLMHYISGITLDANRAVGAKYQFWTPNAFNKLPVIIPSWFCALRFANWMHNGQGSGDTETGSYTLTGRAPIPENATAILRNPQATWVVPSIDEWYKAAFHKNDGVTGNYWRVATSREIYPYSAKPPGYWAPDPANTGNYYWDDGIANGYNDGYARTGSTDYFPGQITLTDVAAYLFSVSPYGTWDQFGNMDEWTETTAPVDGTRFIGPDTAYDYNYGSMVGSVNGFRLAKVPEPTSLQLGAVFLTMYFTRRSR